MIRLILLIMVSLVFFIILFLVSLFILIKSADYFTKTAEKIGIYFGIPAFLVGVTIVSIGTSLPELVSSIFAVIRGSSEMVIGNVLGSNIANIFLVLGLAAIIGRKLVLTYEISHVDLPLLMSSAFLLALTIWDGVFTLFDAALCLGGLVIYGSYTIATERKHHSIEAKKEMQGELRKKKLKISTWIILFISAFFIYLGAKFTVESVIEISSLLNIGKDIVAATAIALGTSLPELAVTINAARTNKPEIAVGNILGSNIFNTFAVMGIPALFGTLIIPDLMIKFVLPIMLIGTLLFFFMTQQKKMTKWEGAMLLLFYLFFIVKLFGFV